MNSTIIIEYPKPDSTAEYRAFYGAWKRCTNPRATGYKNYGGRGIEFRFCSFEEFFAEAGPKPSVHHTLDRKDNDGHYEPGNVRWATEKEQNNNRRRRNSNKRIPESVVRRVHARLNKEPK
jgi:hypothetical protein